MVNQTLNIFCDYLSIFLLKMICCQQDGFPLEILSYFILSLLDNARLCSGIPSKAAVL